MNFISGAGLESLTGWDIDCVLANPIVIFTFSDNFKRVAITWLLLHYGTLVSSKLFQVDKRLLIYEKKSIQNTYY